MQDLKMLKMLISYHGQRVGDGSESGDGMRDLFVVAKGNSVQWRDTTIGSH